MRVREYGESGQWVVVIHGGPGAAGYMAPVARDFATDFRVLEPFQRGSSGEPLSVARHIEDLHTLLEARTEGSLPVLAGSSWGAMLALAYAAKHPGSAGPLVLIGCGTFDTSARSRLDENLAGRVGDDLRHRINAVAKSIPDPDRRLQKIGDLLLPAYSYDPIIDHLADVQCDALAHRETWGDMLRLQAEGIYPAAFAAIASPVLMLHGAVDPHPGPLIRDGLTPFVPQLEYHELQHCGHYPWLERQAREEFFTVLRRWLKLNLGEDPKQRQLSNP